MSKDDRIKDLEETVALLKARIESLEARPLYGYYPYWSVVPQTYYPTVSPSTTWQPPKTYPYTTTCSAN